MSSASAHGLSGWRSCATCGIQLQPRLARCPSCGGYARSLSQIVTSRGGIAGVFVPLLGALIALVALPVGPLAQAVVLGLGSLPLAAAAGWVALQGARRDPRALLVRIERTEGRLHALRADLRATERRQAFVRRDLEVAARDRARRVVRRELEQERQLLAAQRRMIAELRRRLERLQLARLRIELAHAVAFRDAGLEAPDIAEEVGMQLAALERSLDGSEVEAARWEELLDDVRLLHRDLTRGVSRLRAASRLDPIADAFDDLGDFDVLPPRDPVAVAGGRLAAAIDGHLERIGLGYEALDDIAGEDRASIVSRVRVRVEPSELGRRSASLTPGRSRERTPRVPATP